jgi:hypothetical protein
VTAVHVENNLHAQVTGLKEHLYGFVNVYLLNTGLELGLFDELRKNGQVGLTVPEYL